MAQESNKPARRRGPGKPFVKGDPRIAPGGLPAEAREFSKRYREALSDALSEPSKLDEAMTRFQAGLHKLAKAFEAGSPWAISEVLDRLIGKPKQSVDLEATGSSQMLVNVIGLTVKDDGGPAKTSG